MSYAARTTDKELEKGRVDRTKVKRYWPGRAPEWGTTQEEETTRERVRTEVAAPVILRRPADDPRLARLRLSREEREDAQRRHRELREEELAHRRRRDSEDRDDDDLEVKSEPEGSGQEEESEDDEERMELESDDERDQARRAAVLAARAKAEQENAAEEEAELKRRQEVRERLRQIRMQEELAVAQQQQDEEEEEEEEESSEYETDSEEEEGRRILKPMFVPKESRETIAEREKLEKEEEQLREAEKRRLEERKKETAEIVRERARLEEAAAKAAKEGPPELQDIDTDDEADPVEGYEEWKKRELRRIQRDREEAEAEAREAEEREKLRNMTEEERAAWQKANPKVVKQKVKEKWKFLQKYWHKGAFYQEEADDIRGTAGTDNIFKRSYAAPTGEDKFDRSVLPKVMQVRNFGRSGRTKWTHLLAEDTMQQANEVTAARFNAAKELAMKRQRGGSAEEFAKPKKFKR